MPIPRVSVFLWSGSPVWTIAHFRDTTPLFLCEPTGLCADSAVSTGHGLYLLAIGTSGPTRRMLWRHQLYFKVCSTNGMSGTASSIYSLK